MSEAKIKSVTRQNISNFIFDSKFRFALLASLRSAIFSEIQVDNLLASLFERSEAKSAKRSFASKIKNRNIFATLSRF
jgi:hypothetical protein